MKKVPSRLFSPTCLLSVLMIATNLASGQSSDPTVATLRSVVPPSPNAASLGKYADWPVSLYTGLPNINIPLYEVKEGSITVPIGLSYHASGNKVGDIASWVGLGWSLNAGGVITRSMRGLPDDLPVHGYLDVREDYTNPANLFSATSLPAVADLNKLNSAANSTDTQPDVFMLNALGQSFKFMFMADGTISTIPASKVRITSDWSAKTWTVILEDGTKLLFGSMGYIEVTTPNDIDSYFSTWYLKKITSVNNDDIDLTYGHLSNVVGASGFTEASYKRPAIVECSCSDPRNQSASVTGQSVAALYVTSIESDDIRVDFDIDLALREDLSNGVRLSDIKIWDKNKNELYERFHFVYKYSTALYSDYVFANIQGGASRLKLLGIEKFDKIGGKFDTWNFEYNPLSLPNRYSYAQDYWGYYNGELANQTLLPLIIDDNNVPVFPYPEFKNANRDPDSVAMQAEILQKIIYPTGGTSTFEFEANGYPANEETFEPDPRELFLQVTEASNSVFTSFETITVTKPQYVTLSFQASFSPSYLGDHAGQLASAALVNQTDQTAHNLVASGSIETSGTFFLTPGSYKYSVMVYSESPSDFDSSDDYVYLWSSMTYEKSLGLHDIKHVVGGLRIKAIRQKDNISSVETVRHFSYNDPFVISPIKPISFVTTITEQQMEPIPQSGGGLLCDYNPLQNCYQPYLVRHSTTKEGLGDIQGGPIGYGKVKVIYGNQVEGGYSISTFSHSEDGNTGDAEIFPFPSVCPLDWRRGLLLEQIDYLANGDRVQRIKNCYDFEVKPSIVGYKAGHQVIKHVNAITLSDIVIGKVEVKSEVVKSLTTKNVKYSLKDDVLDSVVTDVQYFYDNPDNINPVRTETTDSHGEVISTVQRTPLEKDQIADLSSNTSAAIDEMINRNILGITLETEQTIGGRPRYKVRTNYKIDASDIIVPENVHIKQGAAASEERVRYTRYDSQGNLLEQSKVNDLVVSYLWGYNYSRPVAEVKNATYQAVVDALGQSTINSLNTNPGTDGQVRSIIHQLRTHPSMSKAQITCYTYDRVKGVTSVTDPNNTTTYYEYDSLGRLQLVRDRNNNIIKKYEYSLQAR